MTELETRRRTRDPGSPAQDARRSSAALTRPDESIRTLFGSGLGLDSLDAVELVVCLESEFGLRVTDSTVPPVVSLANKVIDLALAERGAS
jgi:acyl carrier protein